MLLRTPLWPWFKPQVVHTPIIEDIDITDGNKKPYPSPPILTQIYPKPPQKKRSWFEPVGVCAIRSEERSSRTNGSENWGGLTSQKGSLPLSRRLSSIPKTFASHCVSPKQTNDRGGVKKDGQTNKQTDRSTDKVKAKKTLPRFTKKRRRRREEERR